MTVETIHSNKTFRDVQPLVPYHHYENGEGFHHMPEVGAHCMIGSPSDNTPAIIMGYIAPPRVLTSSDDAPERSTMSPEGSSTDVSYQSKRPDLNPGDLGISGRDENFLIIRRGGIVQIGATGIAQRIYIPIGNFIKDFCENYEMSAVGGDVAWTVERPELDPTGKAPCSWTMHMHEFAADKKATVRIRHLPLSSGGAKKSAWEVHVAPQGIDKESGAVSSATYSMLVLTDGTKTEFVGGSRSVTVNGDDTLAVKGKRTVTVKGEDKLTVDGGITMTAKGSVAIDGAKVELGGIGAVNPVLLGNLFASWFAGAVFDVKGVVATPNPATVAALQTVMSRKVFSK